MDTLNRKIIVIVIGLIVLCIGIMAHSQSTNPKTDILKDELIKQLQAQIEQLQVTIKTQEAEIQRLKALCKKAGIETKPMEKQLKAGGKILELYQKYKNKYALLGGEYLRLPKFDLQEWHNIVWEDYTDTLEKWAVGEFGSIVYCKVMQILGPDEMLVICGHFSLFYDTPDVYARFRGWSTENLVDRRLWSDPYWKKYYDTPRTDIAIVGTYQHETILGTTSTVFDVVPLALFEKGLSKAEFLKMLKEVDNLPKELSSLKPNLTAIEMKE